MDTKSKADGSFLLSMKNVNLDDSWLLDSGCTHDVSNRRDWFVNQIFKNLDIDMVNTAANPKKQTGAILKAKGIKSIMLNMLSRQSCKKNNVYSVPDVRRNLMLVSQIERKDHVLTIKGGVVAIRHINTNITCVAYRNDLYVVKTEINKEMNQLV